MKKWKEKIGMLGMFIGAVSVTSVVLQAATSDVNKYSTIQEVKDLLQSQKLEIYPVGSVYLSTSGTNPSSFLGGSWVAWGSGRVPVGINTGDGNFNTVEKTGGTASETLSVAQLPSHSHTFTGSGVTSSGNSVTPSASFTGQAVNTGNNSATPTASFSGSTVNTGNNSVGHTHSIPALSGSTNAAGGHTHQPANGGVFYSSRGSWSSEIGGLSPGGAFNESGPKAGVTRVSITNESGSHSHTVSTGASATGGISANHYHSVTAAGSVALSSTTHIHSVTASGTVSLANTSHTHSMTAAGSNSYTGSGAAQNNLQPYITCYMWKRTS